MDGEAIKKRVRAEVARAGSMAALAREWGVSSAHIHDILSGKRGPGPAILEPLGLEKVVPEPDYREKVEPGGRKGKKP